MAKRNTFQAGPNTIYVTVRRVFCLFFFCLKNADFARVHCVHGDENHYYLNSLH